MSKTHYNLAFLLFAQIRQAYTPPLGLGIPITQNIFQVFFCQLFPVADTLSAPKTHTHTRTRAHMHAHTAQSMESEDFFHYSRLLVLKARIQMPVTLDFMEKHHKNGDQCNSKSLGEPSLKSRQ